MKVSFFKPTTTNTHYTLALAATVLCVLVCQSQGAAAGAHTDTHDRMLDNVISALERMTSFFSKDYASVNVDCLFGIRVGQGSVLESLSDCRHEGFQCPTELKDRLDGLRHHIQDVTSHAMPYVEAQDPEYYHHFLPVIDSPYIMDYKTERIQDVPEAGQADMNYDEEAGDKCLYSLLGQYDNAPKCTVTDDCWDMMTEYPTSGYKITHQLLYFIVAEKNGCTSVMADRLRAQGVQSLRGLEGKLCARILAEAQSEEQHGKVNIMNQDLFLEQSSLCGILGFQNFMTADWVRMVLSWQNSEGCYTFSPSLHHANNAMHHVNSRIHDLRTEEMKLMKLMHEEADRIERSSVGTGRKLMREHLMAGNCLAHKTGLAFGLVGAYVRHYVRLVYGPESIGA